VNVLVATAGPEDTRELAAALADALVDGDLLVLTGDLGAGKTCFTQGLGHGLGIGDRITSPTFTLANRYQGRLVLNHLDVYRLNSVAETLDLGLGELTEDGVTVIEWGDKINEVLPQDHLLIRLRYPDLGPEGDNTNAVDDAAFDRRLIEFVSPSGPMWGGHDLRTVLRRWLVSAADEVSADDVSANDEVPAE
jgi:tRNA threonylcarbamoyladenosine biosynthesis protein TsaE